MALSFSGIMFLSPFFLIVALAIMIEDGLPVFYVQKRLGKDFKEFDLIKFRSMIKHAEKKSGAVLASENDDRITKTGKLCRKTALDELPQLFNILKGDISVVGPRPERPELVEKIIQDNPDFIYRNAVKPGFTGMAQVYGNYDTDDKRKLKYDLFYINNLSFWLDVKLVIKSFIMTIKGNWSNRGKRKRLLRQTVRRMYLKKVNML